MSRILSLVDHLMMSLSCLIAQQFPENLKIKGNSLMKSIVFIMKSRTF